MPSLSGISAGSLQHIHSFHFVSKRMLQKFHSGSPSERSPELLSTASSVCGSDPSPHQLQPGRPSHVLQIFLPPPLSFLLQEMPVSDLRYDLPLHVRSPDTSFCNGSGLSAVPDNHVVPKHTPPITCKIASEYSFHSSFFTLYCFFPSFVSW